MSSEWTKWGCSFLIKGVLIIFRHWKGLNDPWGFITWSVSRWFPFAVMCPRPQPVVDSEIRAELKPASLCISWARCWNKHQMRLLYEHQSLNFEQIGFQTGEPFSRSLNTYSRFGALWLFVSSFYVFIPPLSKSVSN